MSEPTAATLFGSGVKLSALGAVNMASTTVVGVKSLAWLGTPVTPSAPVSWLGTYSNHAWLPAYLRVWRPSSSVACSS